MGVSVKTIGRSILESMFFLAVLSGVLMVLDSVPILKKLGIPPLAYFPIVCGISSAIVGYTFPKPTFKMAFWKLFIGGLITFLIFLGLTLALGAAVFTAILDGLWSGGGFVWDRAAGEGIVGGIVAIIFYIVVTIVLVGIFFAGLFALTNFLVLLVMNSYVERNAPATAIADSNSSVAPSPETPRGEEPFS